MQTDTAIAALRAYSASDKSGPTRHFGTRFDSEGNFLNEPGNTIVSHVTQGSATQAALVEVRTRLMELPFAHHFSFTPVSSLHMTLAQGVIEFRRKDKFWPDGVDHDADIGGITDLYCDRLMTFPDVGAFRTRAVAVTPLGVTLAGATGQDESTLRCWRDELCEPLGFRHPDHDDYVFHITLAYLIDWLPEEALPVYAGALADCTALLQARAPTLDLDDPYLCSFEDMNHFEPLLNLRRADR